MMNKKLTIVDHFVKNNRVRDDIVEARKQLGWAVQQVSFVSVNQIDEASGLDKVFTDFVLWRGLGNNTDVEGARLKYILNRSNRICINTDDLGVGAGALSSNKYFQHAVFTEDDFLKDYLLPTYQALSHEHVESLLTNGKINFPFVIKDVYGSLGKEITLITNYEDLSHFVFDDSFRYIVQQYIDEDFSYRIFVIGGVPLGIMKKRGDASNPGNFVAKSGGVIREAEDDPKTVEFLNKIATKAADVMRLQYAGVDIIKDVNDRFYLIETNNSAGWSNGYCEITGWDLPKEILLYFEAMGLMRFDSKSEDEAREIMDRRREELGLQKIPWYGKIDVSKFK